MICSGCFREVPDLLGPGHDLCPECLGISSEDYLPAYHEQQFFGASGLEASHGDLWTQFAEDFADYLLGQEGEDLPPGIGLLDEGDDDPIPLFGGKPRF